MYSGPGIAAVAGISPMVGAVVAVGMGREEFAVTCSMWLVGASPIYQCRSLCLWCLWAESSWYE